MNDFRSLSAILRLLAMAMARCDETGQAEAIRLFRVAQLRIRRRVNRLHPGHPRYEREPVPAGLDAGDAS